MISFDVAIQFILVSIVLGFAPGPDNTYVLMQSAISGTRRGIAVTMGLCTGIIVHTVAVALGVAAIFQASALAFTLLKIVGAVYLLYLAYGAFKASNQALSDTKSATTSTEKSIHSLYLRGILMNLTNPKVGMFFLAFLPQFVRAEAGPIPFQIAQLGLLFILVTLVSFSLIAFMAGQISGWLRRSPRAFPIMNKLVGCLFVGMAVKLATAQR